MKAELASTARPNIIITVSWREAQILRSVCGGINGASENRAECTDKLYDVLSALEIDEDPKIVFSGVFK